MNRGKVPQCPETGTKFSQTPRQFQNKACINAVAHVQLAPILQRDLYSLGRRCLNGRWPRFRNRRCNISITAPHFDWYKRGIFFRRGRLQPHITAPRIDPIAAYAMLLGHHRNAHTSYMALRNKLPFEIV